jgi:hypothetical protein
MFLNSVIKNYCKMFLMFIFCLFSFLLFSCSDSTAPPNNGSLDTTSHNFTWTIDTIGTGATALRDVSIINENDIWVVGEIYLDGEQDSYNAIHWNGDKWELHHIPAVTSYGTISKMGINAVYAFNENNIWMFAYAGSYVHWNGSEWKSEVVYESKGSIYKIWGSSSKNLYFVGSRGNITHFDGTNWTLIESGTDKAIQDIWGVKTGDRSYEVLCIACDKFQYRGINVMRINDNQVEHLDTLGLSSSLSGIWFSKAGSLSNLNNITDKYFITGAGLYSTDSVQNKWEEVLEIPAVYSEAVRGNHLNDVFVVGHFALLAHWNGSTWFHTTGNSDIYRRVAVKGDIVVIVGSIVNGILSGPGKILRGKRY